MTQPVPPRIDIQFLLHAAELLPGDPQVDDFGPLYAALGRVYAHAMGRDVYASHHLKAAALLETMVHLPCLEHSNSAFAWHVCEAFLALGGYRLDYAPKDAVGLVRDISSRTVGVAQITRQLHTWTTA